MGRKLIIAIDGPAGAGKSTVAKIVAQSLRYNYIDTGAMYRAVTWCALQQGIAGDEAAKLGSLARTIDLTLDYVDGRTIVKVAGRDITDAIRTPQVSRLVPIVSTVGGVRAAMVDRQRQMAASGGVVMDGRDIGTHVLPNADIKIYLTASIDERARRRWLEMQEKGFATDLVELTAEIAERDRLDCQRDIAPLVRADDAVLIDTTALTIEQAVADILLLCEERAKVV
jgi:cytidylate kinase